MKERHCYFLWRAMLVLFPALAVFLAYTDALPDHRLTGAVCAVAMVLLVMVWPLVAIRAFDKSARKRGRVVQVGLIALGYTMLVIAIFPRIAAAYYTSYDLEFQRGTFTTYIASKYGEQKARTFVKDNGDKVRFEYIDYGRIQKLHGTKTWTAPNGELIRKEAWKFDLRHGPMAMYHRESGRVYVAGQYRRGRKHGRWDVFTKEGQPYASGIFDDGVAVDASWKYYAGDGTVESEGAYRGDDVTFTRG